ncbi:MAG: GNAT family N-acetyltransferase [Janthinobacterium lividum]
MIEESRKTLECWFNWAKEVRSPRDCERTARIFYSDFILRKEFNFLIFKDSHLVGSCSFHDMNFNIPSASIGYYLHQNEQGKGYMYEAISALTSYGFSQIGLGKISIICNEENVKSILLAEKLDFKLEMQAKGILPNSFTPGPGKENDLLQIGRLYARYDANGLK